MLSKHERDYGLGMDALVSVGSWDTNRINPSIRIINGTIFKEKMKI